jgi:hypothetical protein
MECEREDCQPRRLARRSGTQNNAPKHTILFGITMRFYHISQRKLLVDHDTKLLVTRIKK